MRVFYCSQCGEVRFVYDDEYIQFCPCCEGQMNECSNT